MKEKIFSSSSCFFFILFSFLFPSSLEPSPFHFPPLHSIFFVFVLILNRIDTGDFRSGLSGLSNWIEMELTDWWSFDRWRSVDLGRDASVGASSASNGSSLGIDDWLVVKRRFSCGFTSLVKWWGAVVVEVEIGYGGFGRTWRWKRRRGRA